MTKISPFIVSLLLVIGLAHRALASDAAELQALRAQVQALEQQVKNLARQIELKEAALGPEAGKVTVTDHGYAMSSRESDHTIHLRALLQLDARQFFDDGGISNDTLTLRRARLITEGSFSRRYNYQFVTEFGGSSVSILDANFSVKLADAVTLKVGKFKTPVGLEVLQSDAATSFTERSILAGFLPNRDLGVQLGGTVAGGLLSYAAGVFNGVADGANSSNVDFDEKKDAVVRLVATPFNHTRGSPFRGLAIGVGASEGRHETAAGRAGGYRSDGQQVFFTFNPAVIADGRVRRFSPQLDYRAGPFGLMAEYALSTATMRASAVGPRQELKNRGWQVTTGYVLTGEDSTYGQVAPRSDFNPAAGTWGAFEVFARYADVNLDDAAFPLFASPTTSANEIQSAAVGLNWFLSKAVVFKFNYYQSEFGVSPQARGGSIAPLLRQDEKVFVTRFQLAF
jgi:phosphate-selective porin OprO and OprP